MRYSTYTISHRVVEEEEAQHTVFVQLFIKICKNSCDTMHFLNSTSFAAASAALISTKSWFNCILLNKILLEQISNFLFVKRRTSSSK